MRARTASMEEDECCGALEDDLEDVGLIDAEEFEYLLDVLELELARRALHRSCPVRRPLARKGPIMRVAAHRPLPAKKALTWGKWSVTMSR